MTRTPRRRRGSNALELALIAPVLVALLAGTIDFGWYLFTQQTVASVVRDAARIGSVTAFVDSPSAEVYDEATAGLTAAGLASNPYSVATTYAGAQPDVTLTVHVKMKYDPLFGFLPMPGAVSHKVTMRMEDQSETSETSET